MISIQSGGDTFIKDGKAGMNIQGRNVVISDSKGVVVNGVRVELPKGVTGNISTIINGKIFINGYEFFEDEKVFRKTLRALWHKWF